MGRFGLQLPIQAQSTYFVEPWEPAAGPAELGLVAEACDRARFDYVAVCDHIAIPDDRTAAMGATWYDTVATLGWLGARTSHVRLLSHVYCVAYRHPLATAKAFATLDTLTGGRVVLGVGAGHVEGEFAALGLDYASRGGATDAAIDTIRDAWADSGAVESGGTTVAVAPPPSQPGGPPIWIGGSSPAALRRAARRGDGWLPQGTTKRDMPDAIARLHDLRADAGRVDRPFTVGAIAPFLFLGNPPWETGPGVLAGTPERITDYLGEYLAMGVDVVQVRFRSRDVGELVEQIERFAAEVQPGLERS